MDAPEAKARILIDAKLTASGWAVQSYNDMNLSAGSGLAITERMGQPIICFMLTAEPSVWSRQSLSGTP